MKDECNQRIIMPARTREKRKNTHPKTEKSKIAEDHIKRMPHSKIFPALAFACIQKFLFRINRVGTNACAEKF